MPMQAQRLPTKTAKRKKSVARGYDWDWIQLSRAYRKRFPLCNDCELLTPATEVHHIQKIEDRPDLRLVPSNLMALCRSCHTARTLKGE